MASPQRNTCSHPLIVQCGVIFRRGWRNRLHRLRCSISPPFNVTWEITSLNLKRNMFNTSMRLVKVSCPSGTGTHEGALNARVNISKLAHRASYRLCGVTLSNQRSKHSLIFGLNHSELKPKNVSNLIYGDNTRRGRKTPFKINPFVASQPVYTHLWSFAWTQTDCMKKVKLQYDVFDTTLELFCGIRWFSLSIISIHHCCHHLSELI